MWRFYGYYGGIGVAGNASTYGQYADDSSFEIIPTWQNKLQAIMYEDALFTQEHLIIHLRFLITSLDFIQLRAETTILLVTSTASGFRFRVADNSWGEDWRCKHRCRRRQQHQHATIRQHSIRQHQLDGQTMDSATMPSPSVKRC